MSGVKKKKKKKKKKKTTEGTVKQCAWLLSLSPYYQSTDS
jgi:hypothetical protein